MIEIEEFEKVKEACITKDKAEKALAKAKKAAAKAAEKAEKAEKAARKMLDEFSAEDFQSFQFSDDYGEEDLDTEEFTEINDDESEDPDLEAACKIYGRLYDVNYFDLGNLGGKFISRLFASELTA